MNQALVKKKNVSDLAFQDLNRRIANLKKGFNEHVIAEINNVPERIFVAHFLPWFSGQVTDTDNSLRSSWVTIAGNEFFEVKVIDDMGQVLFVVPPLVDRDIFPVAISRNDKVADMMTSAGQLAELSPLGAEQRLANQLNGKIQSTKEKGKYDDRWQAIFDRYKLDTSSAQESRGINNGDDGIDMVYDEE